MISRPHSPAPAAPQDAAETADPRASATDHAPTAQELTPAARAVRWIGLTVALSLVLVGMLLLFILPSLASGPRDLPVGVAGPAAVVEQTDAALDAAHPEAFAVTGFDTRAGLEQAVRDREVVGGFDLTEDGTVTSVVASAGSTAVSGTLTETGRQLAAAQDAQAHVDDVVPLPAEDPIGAGIGGLAFPLVFGGIVPVVAYRALLRGHRPWVLAGLLGFSAVGGLVVAWVLHSVFGSFTGPILPVAGAVALGIAALSVPLAGLQEMFGPKGFTLAAMTMMFVGNPFAGIATSSLWLPAGVAAIGQLLPPGAAGTLVRSVAYFDGHGGGTAAVTLVVWIAAGLALWTAAGLRSRRTSSAATTA